MARPLRIEYPGAWYHILNRGRRREKVFFSQDDYKEFLKLLGECTELFNIEIHSYSLIPNHYHLLIRTLKANLSRSMRHLNGVYTQFINRKYKTEGSLFKGRFKSILIEKDNYLLELVRYIHRNPCRAKLENTIGEHEWTSHRGYMNKRERPKWLKTEEVLSEFSEYEGEAQRRLGAFVKEEEPKELSMLVGGAKWPAVLGGEKFTKEIKEKLKGKKIEKGEVPQYRDVTERVLPEDVVRAIEDEFEGQPILSSKKSRNYKVERRAVVYLCRQYLDMPWRETCSMLGGITHSGLSKQFLLAREEVKRKRGCYKDFKKIASRLKLHS